MSGPARLFFGNLTFDTNFYAPASQISVMGKIKNKTKLKTFKTASWPTYTTCSTTCVVHRSKEESYK